MAGFRGRAHGDFALAADVVGHVLFGQVEQLEVVRDGLYFRCRQGVRDIGAEALFEQGGGFAHALPAQ